MKAIQIEVHIEELVLHGFAPVDRYRLGAALELELARLLSEQGVPRLLTGSAQLAQIDAGEFRMKPRGKPQKIGAQIAQAIYGGMSDE
jgi:hypothetical protein